MVLAPQNIIAVVTRCSDQRCNLKFGAVVKLFNYVNMEALVNIRSLYSCICPLWFVVLMFIVRVFNACEQLENYYIEMES